jgi:hypothetical protein
LRASSYTKFKISFCAVFRRLSRCKPWSSIIIGGGGGAFCLWITVPERLVVVASLQPQQKRQQESQPEATRKLQNSTRVRSIILHVIPSFSRDTYCNYVKIKVSGRDREKFSISVTFLYTKPASGCFQYSCYLRLRRRIYCSQM